MGGLYVLKWDLWRGLSADWLRHIKQIYELPGITGGHVQNDLPLPLDFEQGKHRGGRRLRGAAPVIGWPGARLAGAGGRGEGDLEMYFTSGGDAGTRPDSGRRRSARRPARPSRGGGGSVGFRRRGAAEWVGLDERVLLVASISLRPNSRR
jgi:hypothetical protein